MKGRAAARVDQALVDVARTAGQIGAPFGHKGDRLAETIGDFLNAVFQKHMAVGHGQGVGVADIDLALTRPPFAFGILHRDAGRLQLGADGAHYRFFLGSL